MEAMRVAEHLYIQGYLSYPRTESTGYPPGFDFVGTLRLQARHEDWGEFARAILERGPVPPPRGGVDAGDHPPITPMRAATEAELGGGSSWRIYDFVARSFIASLSEDCRYTAHKVVLSVGGEEFSMSGRTLVCAGWTAVLPHQVRGMSLRPSRLTYKHTHARARRCE